MMMTNTLTKSPFAASYQKLTGNGFHVLPVAPDSKAPSQFIKGRWLPMRDWQKLRETPPTDLQAKLWATWPQGNIGILTGTPTGDGLVLACVDFDSDDPDILETLTGSIPNSNVTKKGRRGFSAFYQVPVGTKGFRTPFVELLTDTRQTVVPPSVHPDTGQPYRWTSSQTLLDTPAGNLVELDGDALADFRKAVAALSSKDAPVVAAKAELVHVAMGEETIWRRLNNQAYANLDAWVPDLGLPKLKKTGLGYQAVAHWRASTSGRPIEARDPNLSIMKFGGARDFGTGHSYTAIDLVKESLSLDLDAAFEWLGTRLGMVDAIPFATPAHDPETGEIIEPPALTPKAKKEARESRELPDRLTRVPGVMGDIVEWIVASNPKPNRTMALGAAFSVIGALLSRAVAGPTNNACYLYTVCIAPSGAGKDYPRDCCNILLEDCNSIDLLGPSDFKSSSALVNFLKRQGAGLCPMDELGMFLGRVLSAQAKPHDSDISGLLRSLWGLNFKSYRTPEWAAVKSEIIECTSLGIYGASTLDELFAAMTGKDVMNGFLNRWLFLPTYKRQKFTRPRLKTGQVPQDLSLKMANLRTWANQVPTDWQGHKNAFSKTTIRRQLAWGAGAEALWDKVSEEVYQLEETAAHVFFVRANEMGIRLATCLAASQYRDVVELSDLQWGLDVSHWAAKAMMELASGNIAENQLQRDYNRVRNIIQEAGSITKRDVLRKIKRSIKNADLTDILETLAQSGEIAVKKTIPIGGGPPTFIYEFLKGE
jgi:Bifunctional DNA primase/polymerase, N-terminal